MARLNSLPLTPHLGSEVEGLTAEHVAAAISSGSERGKRLASQLAGILRARSLVLLRSGSGELMCPADLRAVYTAVHHAMGMTLQSTWA